MMSQSRISRWRLHRRKAFLALFVVGIPMGIGLLLLAWVEFDPTRLELPSSVVFLDSRGEPIRALTDDKGERHLWVAREGIPERLIEAFLAAEDKRFFNHPGFDPLAIARAALANWEQERIVSGASTLTQQLVRSIYPRPRTYRGKLTEVLRAIKAEMLLAKEDILEGYLNHVPLGNGMVGVGIAARSYFGKAPEDLTLAECATLAAIPKAPGKLSPYRQDPSALRERRNWVLRRMAALELITSPEAEQAAQTPIRVRPRRYPNTAPHYVDLLVERGHANRESGSPWTAKDSERVVRTLLDAPLQRHVEETLRSHRERLADLGASQASVLVIRNRDMAVLALAGSIEYSARALGYNNGVVALRSPGSALKPFLYGLAFDSGFSPATLLADTERRYRSPRGEYDPRNFDRRAYGPTTVRSALGNSLNLAAVRTIQFLGYPAFHQKLTALGLLNDPSKGPDYYGLGLAIGNPEVSLEQLVTAYAAVARGGVLRPLRYLAEDSASTGNPVMTQEAAFLVADILSDPNARSLTFGSLACLDFPYRVGWKTGTSTRYRDGWIVGFTPDYTLGAWVGNFDGGPMKETGGAHGAGPIFSDILRHLYAESAPTPFTPPATLEQREVCGHSGMRPTRHCPSKRLEWFRRDQVECPLCTFHGEEGIHHELEAPFAGWLFDREARGVNSSFALASGTEDRPAPSPVEILYPLDGTRFILNQGADTVRLEAGTENLVERVTWFVDGVELGAVGPPYRLDWELAPGAHRIAAIGPGGIGDEIRVQVE
ncbi:MAG: Monofunctional biosynthetic peptidoglycan transglycosylase [bacterium]|nr:Monofunctional biosynthetic peptidoglycan transglycosylase [bacterium]